MRISFAFSFFALTAGCLDLDTLQSDNGRPPPGAAADMATPPVGSDLAGPPLGGTWSLAVASPNPLRAIRGWDGSRVWAVGDSYQLVTWNGALWTSSSIPSPPSGYFNSLWFRSRDTVYVAGQGGYIMMYSSGTWATMRTTAGFNLYALTGRDGSTVELAGAGSNPDNKLDVWTGSAWARLDYGTWPGPLWGAWTQPEAFLIAGAAGVLRLPVGGSQITKDPGTVDGITYWALFGLAGGAAWTVGSDGHIATLGGSTWNDQRVFPGHVLRAMSGTSPQDLWTVGDAGFVAHFDGAAWREQAVPAAAGYNLTGVWADPVSGAVYVSATTTSDTAGAVFLYR